MFQNVLDRNKRYKYRTAVLYCPIKDPNQLISFEGNNCCEKGPVEGTVKCTIPDPANN